MDFTIQDPEISWDYNSGFEGDGDPTPAVRKGYPNSHGTRCAGEIAMKPNNNICGVGVAYGSKIGTCKMQIRYMEIILDGNFISWKLYQIEIILDGNYIKR